MPSPFPGMDPYIEMPRSWTDFHGDLAGEIRAQLNDTIRPTYFAALTSYVTNEVVEVTQKLWATAVAPVVETEPVESVVALELPLELFRVEIRTAADDLLVTLIEILSPVNKQRSHDAHIDYLHKRRDLLRSAAHLIEIDWLRAGVRPLLERPVPLAPYYVMLSRATTRPQVTVWPIQLNFRLPVIPIPLLEPDPHVSLDLGAIVASVYERGGYDARIRYSQPVPPPVLSEGEAAWVETLLAHHRTAS
jgi:hypothetical protein